MQHVDTVGNGSMKRGRRKKLKLLREMKRKGNARNTADQRVVILMMIAPVKPI